MSILSNYKIIKELGHGMFGTVYLILFSKANTKKKYALKIEHVLNSDIKKNLKSTVWREIEFCNNFASKYPEQFIQLIEYDFIDKCEHIQTYTFDFDRFPKQMQTKFNKLASSKYCIRKIFSLIDGTLDKIIDKLNVKQMYSMIIQYTYIIHLLHSNNYIHGDLHPGNIGYIQTNQQIKIKILNYNVPTFGYMYKAIDFGMVMNKNNISNKNDLIKYNDLNLMKNELSYFKSNFVDKKLRNIIFSSGIKTDFNSDYKKFKIMPEYKIILKFTNNKYNQMFIFDLMYPEQYQKLIFGDKFEKVIPRKLRIPIEDILVFIKMYKNPIRVIQYFMSKL